MRVRLWRNASWMIVWNVVRVWEVYHTWGEEILFRISSPEDTASALLLLLVRCRAFGHVHRTGRQKDDGVAPYKTP